MRSSWLKRTNGLFLLIVTSVSCFSAACVAIATTRGTVLSHDSVAYIGAARSLLAGRGLVIPFGAALPLPLTHWPPLYPLILAMAGLLIPEIEGAARWLSIGLFALNTILIATLARKLTNSPLFGCAGAFVFASSFAMWQLHAMAMADPLFIFLVLTCTYFLDEHLRSGKQMPLLIAAIAAGLSVETRYAGLPFVLWGATLIFFLHRSSPRRWIDAGIWTLAAGSPMMLGTAWNLLAGGTVAPRTLAWHPQNIAFFVQMLAGAGEDILRGPLTAAGCFILAPFALAYLIRRSASWERYLTFLIALNVVFLTGVGFFLDAILDVRRAMKPTFPFLILLAACAGSRLLRTRLSRIAVVAGVCAAIALPNFPAMHRWVGESSRNPRGFGARQWRQSATMAFIRELPAKTIVYTNLPEPIYLITGRNARLLPLIEDPTSSRALTRTQIDLAVTDISRLARSGDAAAVYFLHDPDRMPFVIAGSDLAIRSGLTVVRTFDDGTAYTSGEVPFRAPE